MNRLPELLSNAVNTLSTLVAVFVIALGIVCVLAGNKFYWLSAGLNAFLAAYVVVSTVMNWPAWQNLLAAGVTGLLVGLITIAIQQISFTLNGFFIFGLLVSIFFTQLAAFDSDSFIPVIVFFVAGSAAAFFNLMKPSVAVIYTTAFIGGFAVVCGLSKLLPNVSNALYIVSLWAVLGVAGSLFQLRQIARRRIENSL